MHFSGCVDAIALNFEEDTNEHEFLTCLGSCADDYTMYFNNNDYDSNDENSWDWDWDE